MKVTLPFTTAEQIRPHVARDLLRIEAVTLSPDTPFTWASGLKAPLYCDNRLTMAYPTVRFMLTKGFLMLMLEHNLKPEVIVGTVRSDTPAAARAAKAAASVPPAADMPSPVPAADMPGPVPTTVMLCQSR